MGTDLAYLAGCGAGLCYGLATVLEQIASKKEKHFNHINPSIILKLLKQIPYIQGIVLDIVGWLLVLYAVRLLPLFLVQSFIASSLVVSAIIDYYWLKTTITTHEKISIFLVLVGIIVLGIVAHAGPSVSINQVFEWCVIVSPIVLFGIGLIIIRSKVSHLSSIALSVLAGLAFGGTSIVARMVNYHNIRIDSKTGLLILALIFYAILGMTLLTIALQREKINHVNSVLFSIEVIIPSILGLYYLGDKVNKGQNWLLFFGLILVIAGAGLIAIDKKQNKLKMTG